MTARGGARRFDVGGHWRWPFSAIAGAMRPGWSFVWRRRRMRIMLLSVLLALPPLLGGWLWLRDSSLVSVERVQISGVHGPDAQEIDAALVGAARHMTTLDVSVSALRAAVARFPIVRSVRPHASFPHMLRAEVVEQLPVAALVAGGARTAVAADGVVLGPSFLSSSLPTVNATGAAAVPVVGHRAHGAALLGALLVLGAAPAPLAQLVTHAYMGPQGLTVVLRDQLLAYFGNASRPHAKWLSLARVLADPGSAGAAYVDVRVPERPAAGFPSGTTAPILGSAEAEPSSTSDPASAAELAAALEAGVGGGSSSSTGAGSTSSGEPASTGSAASGTPTSTPSQVAPSTSVEPSAVPSTSVERSAVPPASGG
jgi:cell division protein FtsQ